MLSSLLLSGHEFIGINSFLFVALILCCLLIGGIIKKFHIKVLPESGATMIFGFICGAFLNLTSDSEKSILEFNPNLIFFVLLPPIILDAGYSLKRKDFFQNVGTIFLLAIVGTVINNIVFGYLLYACAKAGWIPLDDSSPLESLLFGAVISATDPVATLGILGSKEVNADPLLYSLVFGESVLNDAIAIVLYKTFESAMPVVDETTGATEDGNSFTTWDLFKSLFTFLGVSLGSVVVGVFVALFCCFIFKRVDMSAFPIYEFTLVTLFAFMSYFLAEMLYLSGIMSLFFCSILLAHYNYYNISTNAQIATQECFKSIAQICETFVFAYLGITAGLSIKTTHLQWSVAMIFLVIIICQIARAANVFPLCFLASLRRRVKIPFRMQIPLWFAGNRGALCLALSLSFPGSHMKYVVSTTLTLALFTTIVGGAFTLPVLKATGMTGGSPSSDADGHEDGHAFELLHHGGSDSHADHDDEEQKAPNGSPRVNGSPNGSDGAGGGNKYTGLVARFKKFDQNIMRRFFGGAQSARGHATGLMDRYGANITEPTTVTHAIPAHLRAAYMHDPELVAIHGVDVAPQEPLTPTSTTRNIFLDPPASQPALELSAIQQASPVSVHPSAHGGHKHNHQHVSHSYKQDQAELKSIFQQPSAAVAAANRQAAAGYQPPSYTSPSPTTALMSANEENPFSPSPIASPSDRLSQSPPQ